MKKSGLNILVFKRYLYFYESEELFMTNDNVKNTKNNLISVLIPDLDKYTKEDKTLLKGIAIGMRIKSEEIKSNNSDEKIA